MFQLRRFVDSVTLVSLTVEIEEAVPVADNVRFLLPSIQIRVEAVVGR
jgi:hypothetical protein